VKPVQNREYDKVDTTKTARVRFQIIFAGLEPSMIIVFAE
jgi:hypothetical protein